MKEFRHFNYFDFKINKCYVTVFDVDLAIGRTVTTSTMSYAIYRYHYEYVILLIVK